MNQTKIIHGIKLKPRQKVPPRETSDMTTVEDRERLMAALRMVVEEHREVLEKLANR
jgi:hypothetical protein